MLDNNPNTRTETSPGTHGRVVWLNTTKPPFDDKRVRQAIAYAINYDLIIDELLLGYSDPLKGLPFMETYIGDPGYRAFDEVVSPYDYNPEKAKALLEEAGVSGLTTVVDCWDNEEEAQAFAQMLQEIGINASVRVWEYAIINEEIKKGERDIYYSGFGNARRAPQWAYHMAGTGEPSNYTHYSNPVFDDLMIKAMEMADSPERNQLFIEAFEIIIDELPFIALHVPRVVEACRANVKNFYPHNAGRLNLHRVNIE